MFFSYLCYFISLTSKYSHENSVYYDLLLTNKSIGLFITLFQKKYNEIKLFIYHDNHMNIHLLTQ